MSSSKSTVAALIFGGISFLSLSFLVYYFYFRPSPSVKSILDDAQKKSAEKKVEATQKKAEVTVEDDESSSEEEEESDDDEEEGTKAEPSASSPKPTDAESEKAKAAADEAAALKEQYDAAIRMSTRLIQGNAHGRAIEKLTEAIGLAQHISTAGKDMPTLYNNRSAMYEKLSQYENCLRDITVLLTMDPHHMKARVRRGRVYEAQNKPWESLQDYVYAMILERIKGEQPSNDRKIATLCKKVAVERTPKVLKEIRGNSGSHAFPSKFYIKSVLEAYPTFFTWQHVYNEASSSTLKTSLQTAVLDAKDALAEDSTVLSTSYVENQNRYLESSLNLIQYELAHTAYNDAFALLHALSEHVDEVVAVVTKDISSEGALDLVYRKDLLSTYFEFLGLEANLRSNIEDAAKHYKTGASFSERNTSVKLKLASLHLDLGEHEEAKQIFDHLLALWSEELETANTPTSTTTTDNEDDAIYADARSSPNTSLSHGDKKNVPSKEEILFNRAWVYIHRASLFIARDAEGNYREDAIEKAISDLDNAIKDTANILHVPEAKGAQFTALLKSVHILTQTKTVMEKMVTEEDMVRNRAFIERAKMLFPNHESVITLEAEQVSSDGNVEEALRVLDKASQNGNNATNISLILARASVLTSKAFMDMQNPGAMLMVQATLGDVQELYKKALEIEPNAIEVMAQFAQLKSMVLGDLDNAVAMLKQALPLARSRDEVQELCQLLAMNEAQLNAINFMKEQSD